MSRRRYPDERMAWPRVALSLRLRVRAGARALLVTAVLMAAVLWSAGAQARDKTDVVKLRNGDQVTCEIIRLEYGILEVKTDAMSTLYIEWPKVLSIESPIVFKVEDLSGKEHLGTLQPTERGLRVAEGESTVDLHLSDVAYLGPVLDTFWGRVRGSASIGLSFAKASAVGAASFNFLGEYYGERTLGSLGLSGNVNASDGTSTSQRFTVDYSQRFFLQGTHFWEALGSFERIQELGVDGRLQAGAAYGESLYRRKDRDLVVFAGLAVTREQSLNTGMNEYALESLAGIGWRIYHLSGYKTTLNSSLTVYPGLSDAGRVRARFDLSWSHKIASSLTVNLTAYDDYDNRPPGEPSIRNDYGFTTGLGFTF